MASMASISDDESIGVCALFPNRFVNGAEVEQKNLAIKPRLAKGDEMALVKTMKIKLPPGSPSPSEVARTLGATAAEVRSVDRLLDHLVPGSNGAGGRLVAKKSKAAKSKTRRTARKRSH